MSRLIKTQAYIFSSKNPEMRYYSNKHYLQFIEIENFDLLFNENNNCETKYCKLNNNKNILQTMLLCILCR